MAMHLPLSSFPHSKKQLLLKNPSSLPTYSRLQRMMITFSSPARRTANYQPSIWDDSYIQSLPIDFTEEKYLYRQERLKEQVRLLIKQQHSLTEEIELVDVLCQLGLGYHFDSDFKRLLNSICSSMENINSIIEKSNLHEFSLLFRLLREHGISNSSILRIDVLISCFKNANKQFNPNDQKHVKGMLSLYEASYISMEGEEELDEAREIAMEHLRYNNRSLISTQLVEEIDHALELPLHWRMSRLHNRWFIDAYGRRENANPLLIELAKLDFNMVQSIYKMELKEMSRWWMNLNLVCDELSFTRDRLVENYLWTIGCAFQPKFGKSRKAVTMINCLITTIDDIYDVHGTVDELKLFTNSIEEWSLVGSKQLPNYMKICLVTLFNTINDIASLISKEKHLDVLPCLKRKWADLCKAFLVEAMWYHNEYTPTLDEYLRNAWVSVSGICALTTAYCFSDDVTTEALKSLEVDSPIIQYSCMLLRLYNDLGTYKWEIQRGDVPKSIECYMKEKNISESVAQDYIQCLIKNYWKKLNQEYIKFSNYMESFRNAIVGAPRTAQCIYQYGDGIGKPDCETKDQIICILIKPIPL